MLTPLSRAVLVSIIVIAALAANTACGLPGPTPNEINASDEGRTQGAAASRGLTMAVIEDVKIGRSLNRDKTIADEADSFKPNETIHAAIRVRGAANSGLVRAMWIAANGEPVQDDTRIVSPSRGEIVNLQLSRERGLRGGQYRLDVFLDNRLVESVNFSVEGGQAAGPRAPQQGVEPANPTRH
jgi:predicted small lipoprotein YifL